MCAFDSFKSNKCAHAQNSYQTKQKCMKQAKICRIMVVKKGAFGGGLFIIGWNKHRNAFAAIFINIFRMHLYVDEFLLAPISMVKMYKLNN